MIMPTRIPIALGDAGVLAPGRLRPLRALGWMVALIVLAALCLAGPTFIRVHYAPDPAVATALGVAGIVLLYVAYWLAVRYGERRAADEIAPAPAVPETAVGILIGLGMFATVFTILRLIGVYTLAPGNWTDWPGDIWDALATGLFEELMIRAIIFRLLMRAAGPWWALGLSALLFGALHLANPNANLVAAVAIAVEAGLMLAAFYLLTGRLWMSVGVHAAWNFAQGPIFGARVSGQVERGSLFTSGPVPGSPDLLSGGAFGPEASLPAIVVGLAVFLVVMRAWRQGAARSARASAR